MSKEKDECAWEFIFLDPHYEERVYDTGCNTRHYMKSKIIEAMFLYCPFCGKPIALNGTDL